MKTLKGAFLSKTIWFNLLALAVVVATPFGFDEQPSPEWVNQAGGIAIVLVNLLLRTVTVEPLADK